MKKNAWMLELFAAIDSKDVDAFAAHLCEDVRFRFGNAARIQGRDAVCDAVTAFLRSVAAVHHDVSNTWHSADHALCRGHVTYTRHDGLLLNVPFANVFRMRAGRIAEYDIYVDIGRLYD